MKGFATIGLAGQPPWACGMQRRPPPPVVFGRRRIALRGWTPTQPAERDVGAHIPPQRPEGAWRA